MDLKSLTIDAGRPPAVQERKTTALALARRTRSYQAGRRRNRRVPDAVEGACSSSSGPHGPPWRLKAGCCHRWAALPVGIKDVGMSTRGRAYHCGIEDSG